MSFDKLGLSPELLKAVAKQGYTIPTPIQEQAIPLVLAGSDMLASAQTGTGKTASFTLPILHILSKTEIKGRRQPRALILTPTRELAAQVSNNLRSYAQFTNLRSTVIYGGVNQNPQVKALQQGQDIVIATPGRLLDLYNQRHLSLKSISMFVLDEADRMLDMGFLGDIQKIISLMPAQRQNLMFSATFSGEIKKLTKDILNNPATVDVSPPNSTVESISQMGYRVDKSKKKDLLVHLINDQNWNQALVFCRTKHGANNLSEKIDSLGITSVAIHGNKSQGARTKALADFKRNKVRILVATDIAARGLDIPLLPHVVNFDLPNIPEDYVHRIGRTGRAGADGVAISFVSPDEKNYLRSIERLIDFSIPLEELEGFYTPKKPSKKGIARGEGKSVRKSTSSGSSSSSRGYKVKTTSKETAVAKPKDRKPKKRWY
jgi:ATP-dependent RNA helicase RhlE